MAKSQLVEQGLASPVQKNDEGDDLDAPELEVVDDPVRVETSSVHTNLSFTGFVRFVYFNEFAYIATRNSSTQPGGLSVF
jgi:hypothetical protein